MTPDLFKRLTMDKIQRTLIKAGQKELAQEYFEKIAEANEDDYIFEKISAPKSLKQYGKARLKNQMYKQVDKYINSLDPMSDVSSLDFHFSDLVKYNF